MSDSNLHPVAVHQALDEFLGENGFTIQSYDDDFVEIPLGPVTARLPNTAGRKAVVRWHDLHHVITGYGTDLVGEAEIGAWELRAGCTTLAAYVLNSLAVTLGLLIAPIRTYRAFAGARGARSLYRQNLDYAETLEATVLDLRRRAGIPADGIAGEGARLHTAAPVR